VALLLVAAVTGFAMTLPAIQKSVEDANRNDNVLQKVSPNSSLDASIRVPGNDGWVKNAQVTVKSDGTGHFTLSSRTTAESTRELHLNESQRLVLLKQTLSGLNDFQMQFVHPESDKDDLRLTVSVGSVSISARGCYEKEFLLKPLRFLNSTLARDEQFRDSQLQFRPPQTDTRAGGADGAGPRSDQVVVRHTERSLIRGPLHEWKLALEIGTGKQDELKITLNSAGKLTLSADAAAFPKLATGNKILMDSERDRFFHVVIRALERFAIFSPREPADKVEGKTRKCKLSIETRFNLMAIEERDFDANQRFQDDVRKLIDVAHAALRAQEE
jgi:hypothetical protein